MSTKGNKVFEIMKEENKKKQKVKGEKWIEKTTSRYGKVYYYLAWHIYTNDEVTGKQKKHKKTKYIGDQKKLAEYLSQP